MLFLQREYHSGKGFVIHDSSFHIAFLFFTARWRMNNIVNHIWLPIVYLKGKNLLPN